MRWRRRFGRVVALARGVAARALPGVTVEPGVLIAPKASIWCAPGGKIVLRRGVTLLGESSVVAEAGATVEIGESTWIGGHCVIAASESISIGREGMIAEFVSIRDHDHDPAFAPQSGRMLRAPVAIGDRVWIATKATVGRGVRIGDDAVVAAHAFVGESVEANTLVGGVPARLIKSGVR